MNPMNPKNIFSLFAVAHIIAAYILAELHDPWVFPAILLALVFTFAALKAN